MSNIIDFRKPRRHATLLRDIAAAPDEGARQRLQRIAYINFGRLNDLALMRGRWKPLCDLPEILDHPIFQHATFLSKAVIVEPDYSETLIDTAQALADANGLRLWVPPNMFASIRSPGSALFLLFTPLAREAVTLLPEQMHDFAGDNRG